LSFDLPGETIVIGPIVASGSGPTFQYSTVFQVLKDFQPFIVACLGFISIAGAIYGIRLKGRLDDNAQIRVKLENRLATATMVRSFIRSEDLFRDLSLLVFPTEKQVRQMVETGTILDIKSGDYLSYLANISSTLRDFPRPIAERSAFISWVSARVLLACAQKKPVDQPSQIPDEIIKQIRYLVIAGIIATQDLAYELGEYQKFQLAYESRWSPDLSRTGWVKIKETNWPDKGYRSRNVWEGMRSDSFDLTEILQQLAYLGDCERLETLYKAV
jgi:hypothetical protein